MFRISLIAFVLMAFPLAAHAREISLEIDPSVAVPLSAPQSNVYDVGGGQSVTARIGLTPYLDVGPSLAFLLLPASADNAESGMVWGLGGGARLKRPHDRRSFHGASPWLSADLAYIRTGGLNRPGFDLAAGVSIPIGAGRAYRIGPFVRYVQVMQSDRAGFDDRDAKILTLGVSFEVDSTVARKQSILRDRIVMKDVPCPEPQAAAAAADADHDGIPDDIDHCPQKAGLMDNWGCPHYDKVVVGKDKLELKEKLYFAWDSEKLEDASFPLLDEVVIALQDNQGFRVQVEGHTDSSGGDDHNQRLSEKRAEAVVDYLTDHGVAKSRLVSKGFSSSVPTDDNKTAAGRENNRRVEFVVSFVILATDGGSK